MSLFKIHFAPLLLGCLLAVPVGAQTWQDISGNAPAPLRSDRRSLITDGERLYVIGGAEGRGVLVSADAGATFTPLNTVSGASYSLTDALAIHGLHFANGYVYVSSSSGDASQNYLHRLLPGATAWEQAGLSGFPPPVEFNSFGAIADLVYDASTALYYCIAEIGGVYVSSDGRIWQRRTEGFDGIGAPSSLAALDGTVFAVRPLSGVHRTTDGGVTWSPTGFSGVDGAMLRRTGDSVTLVVPGLSGTSVAWVSQDRGDTWLTVPGLPLGMGNFLSGDGSLLFAPTHSIVGRLLFSATAGQNWQDLPVAGLNLTGGPVGQFTPLQFLKLGDSLLVIGNEVVDLSFNQAAKLYRLDVSSFDFRPTTSIITQPQRNGGLAGDPITLRAYAVGENLAYQWFQDGEPIAGATAAELVLANPTTAHTGDYTVVVTGGRGADTSDPVRVTIVAERVDGQLDRSYLPDSLNVTRITRLPDGSFLGVRPTAPSRFTRFDLDGNILAENSLSAGLSGSNQFYPERWVIDTEGRILAIGDDNSNNYGLRRYFADTLERDTSFPNLPAFNGTITDVAELPGRGYLVVGDFSTVGGTPAARVTLVSYDGTVDDTFTADLALNTSPRLVHVRQDGTILVDGTHPNFSPRKLALLDSSGRQISSFPVFEPTPQRIFALRDNRTLIVTAQSSVRSLHLLRADGTFDPGFVAPGTLNNWVEAAVEQPDGKIVLVGFFSTVGGQPFPGIVRLLPNGSIDPTYDTSASYSNNTVYGVAYDPAGFLMLGGSSSSSTFQGQSGLGVARVYTQRSDLTFLNVASSRRVAIGGSTTLHVEAGGTSAINYQWFRDDEPVSGATDRTLTLTDFSAAQGGVYTVRITNASGSLLSAPIQVNAVGAPEILTPPVGASLLVGESHTLSVAVDGAGPFTYQWFRNGEPVPAATASSLALTNVATTAAGLYSVRITNTLGSVTSTPVAVTVNIVTGTRITAFNPISNNAVNRVAVRPDGVVVATGTFTTIGGASATRIAFLNAETGAQVPNLNGAGLNNIINGIAVQADNKVVVAGAFTSALGSTYSRLVRLNADGTVDTTFNAGGAGPTSTFLGVWALRDGRLLVNAGGNYNGVATQGLMRLLPDGTIDPSWNVNGGPVSANNVYAIHEQADGKLLVGGAFGSFGGVSGSQYFVRLLADGAVDLDFLAARPTPNYYVRGLGQQSDGKIIVAGEFTGFTPSNGYARIARLHPHGALDSSFPNTAPNNNILTLQVLLNDKILVGGVFSSIWSGSQSGARSALLLPNGTPDPFYRASAFNGNVEQIVALPDGRAYVAGSFTSGPAGSRLGLMTIDAADLAITGQPLPVIADLGGSATFSASVYTTSTATFQWFRNGEAIDGATAATLEFTSLTRADDGDYVVQVTNDSGTVTSAPARLTVLAEPVWLAFPTSVTSGPGGAATFTAAASGRAPLAYQWRQNGVPINGATGPELALTGLTAAQAGLYDVVISNDLGQLISPAASLSLVSPVGAIDPSFDIGTGPNQEVTVVTRLAHGRLAIGGNFTSFNGQTRTRFAVLEPSGELVNLTTNPSIAGSVNAIVEQDDGKILIGWTTGFRRYNADGTNDTTFPVVNFRTEALAVDATHVYMAGYVSSSASGLRRYARTNGAEDTAFTANNAAITGGFRSRVAYAVHLLPDGKILASHNFGNIFRLLPDGTQDTSFTDPAATNIPRFFLPRPDGKIWVSGDFQSVPSGETRRFLARLNSDGTVDSTLGDVGFDATSGKGYQFVAVGDDLYLAGEFTATIGGQAYRSIVKISGTAAQIDSSFGPILTTNGGRGLAIDDQERLYLGGSFTAPVNRLARIVTRYDGPLEIVGQPQPQTVVVGGRASFAVAWVGGGLGAYQWYRNGFEIDGATSQELVLDPVELGNAGSYHVTITVGTETLTSVAASLTVTDDEEPPAAFATWPALASLPENQRGPLDNPTGDGLSNLLKFALGLDPAVSGTAGKTVGTADVDGVIYPTFSYTRRQDLGNVTLDVEIARHPDFDSDLGSVELSVTDQGDGTDLVLVRSAAPYDAEPQIMRLRATLGP